MSNFEEIVYKNVKLSVWDLGGTRTVSATGSVSARSCAAAVRARASESERESTSVCACLCVLADQPADAIGATCS